MILGKKPAGKRAQKKLKFKRLNPKKQRKRSKQVVLDEGD